MRSYRPEELFDESGRLIPELAALAPAGDKRMSACPYAQRRPPYSRVADPLARVVRAAAAQPGLRRPTRRLGRSASCCETSTKRRRPTTAAAPSGCSAPTKPRATACRRCSRPPTGACRHRCCRSDDHLSPDGRVMEVLSEHLCEGWLEGYVLTGRHGVFATYEAFAMVADVDARPAHEVAATCGRAAVARARGLAERARSPARAGATTTTGSRTRGLASSIR